jgi:hypothetical protein
MHLRDEERPRILCPAKSVVTDLKQRFRGMAVEGDLESHQKIWLTSEI